ncbi:class II fructose-bisphosphate aldolase [Candidatus Woesearchaeota archaeon]|nr:class II fructose-bisphosphate aldolase [Candidatus Woesearchaeota archaeon]
MIVPTKDLFREAYGKYAIGAYNINNAEQTMGLFRGNIDSHAPFIIQLSKGARNYTHTLMLEAMIRAAGTIFPEAIFAVHLDHGDEKTCYDCIDSGFYSSVMIDASDKEFAENIAITRRVVERAHAKGINVEAELGQLGGMEEHVKGRDPRELEELFRRLNALYDRGVPLASIKAQYQDLWGDIRKYVTDPDQAVEFRDATGCDSLACAIGTSHGAYKFSAGGILAYFIVKEIQRKLPGFPLVMHGSSSVPQDEVARINAAGGQLNGARGVDESEVSRVAPMGVTKVNIDTDGRLVWTRVHREYFRDHPEGFDFRKPGELFIPEYARYVAHKNEVLGSAGRVEEVRKALGK